MQVISQKAAAQLIKNSDGRIFSVTFVKRGDRKKMASTPYDRLPRRTMTGRFGATVNKDKTGAGKSFKDSDHGLLTVYEFVSGRVARGRFGNNSTQWRAVPIEGIEKLSIRGMAFQVE